MKKLLLIQHEAYEPLGTLEPLLKREGVRIRYVNFERTPDATPTLDRYHGLVLLGGYMGVYESDRYQHLKTEMKLIEEALKREIPILGICLGSQILAHVLGAKVQKHTEREMGWYDVELTEAGRADPVLTDFKPIEKVFQSHGDTFDIPATAVHLARSRVCEGQAFRYGELAYGLQFHLEIDGSIIEHWFEMEENQEIFRKSGGQFDPDRIRKDTADHIARSVSLSTDTFRRFVRAAGRRERQTLFGSGHRE